MQDREEKDKNPTWEEYSRRAWGMGDITASMFELSSAMKRLENNIQRGLRERAR